MKVTKFINFFTQYGWLVWFSGLVAAVGYYFGEDSTFATITVFFLSLLLFHLVLFRFSKHEKIWKATDYLFEVIAVISIIAAVSGLGIASKQKTLQQAFSERKLAQVRFIYAVELTISHDCHVKESRKDIWTPTPEPIGGECERLESFLPQMKFEFDQETGPDNMTAEGLWGFNLAYDDVELDGTWSMIHTRAKEFLAINKKTEEAIALRDSLKDTDGFDVSKVDKVVYWHHILAFFLALKIARISMSIFKNEQ
tara:strand:- start:974 stop:1735 length:762 start_codon:yes stop_codon:yes gene_type:complete